MKQLLSTVIFLLIASSALAQTPLKIEPLISKPFANIPGKEGLMLTVEFPPGASQPVHHHNAHVFVYVLQGAVVMQVKGGQETKLSAGQSFYESPEDVHVVAKNASATEEAKFLVVMVKDKDAPPVISGE